jgi:hypothetical protein
MELEWCPCLRHDCLPLGSQSREVVNGEGRAVSCHLAEYWIQRRSGREKIQPKQWFVPNSTDCADVHLAIDILFLGLH